MQGDLNSGSKILPPALVHLLRSRSADRLHNMCGGPGTRGFGRYVRTHIAPFVASQKTLPEKAISVAYAGCFLTDHVVQAERRAALLVDGHRLTPDEERTIWEKNYAHVIQRVLAEQPDGPAIALVLERLGNLTTLPARAHNFRTRHWHTLEQWLRGRGENAAQQLTLHLRHAISSPRTPHAKARAVILTGSLLADIECHTRHIDWPEAYTNAITLLYREFAGHGDILGELI